MKRIDRLVLDAIESHGPEATVIHDVIPYVAARRWALFDMPNVYPSLWRLEKAGVIRSHFLDGWYPRRRVYSLVEQPQD